MVDIVVVVVVVGVVGVLAVGVLAATVSPLFQFPRRAVQQNGYALTYAMPELRGDRDVVMAAIERTGWTVRVTGHGSGAIYYDQLLLL